MSIRILPLIILFIVFFFFFTGNITAQSPAENLPGEKTAIDNNTIPVMTYRISDELEYQYEKPKAFAFVKNIIPSTGKYFSSTFTRKNFIYIGGMAAATAVLCLWDRTITDGAHNLGDALGVQHTNNQKTYGRLTIDIGSFRQPIPVNGPHDASTIMYFLGDGFTHLSIAGGFWIAGVVNKDFRARQTASQLAEAIIATGLVVQTLKHITGRESPFAADFVIGKWRPFPNQGEYALHVPHYDAFPSGHLSTAMATVTVIAENYPEKKYIRPLGYSLMGVLGFAMLNNGVHWFSDYPLAIAMGYAFGKIAVNRGRKVIEKRKEPDESSGEHSSNKKLDHRQASFILLPGISDSWNGLTLLCSF